MNFGIIGAGNIARVHAQAIAAMPGCRLHSVCARKPDSARGLAETYGAHAYVDLEAFLSDPDLEIVTVCTPSGAHGAPAVAALRAGKHVLVEKPLEITTRRIDEMMDVAASAGKTLSCVLNRRFHPAMDAFRQAVDAGRFGQLTSASCYVKWYRDQAYYDSAAWRGTWAMDGGGVLMNQAIHAIDSLILLAGPVRSIRGAACGRLAHVGIEVEDTALAIIEFASGACGVIEASTCAWSQGGHPARIQLSGTGGSAFLADESFEVWEFAHAAPEDEGIRGSLMQGKAGGLGAKDPKAIGFIQHQRNFEEIVSAIREGREPSTSAREARKAVQVIEAIYRSAQEGGKTIRFE